MVLVLIGVSGAGKSTVGKLLARTLQFEFYEGDDYHTEASKQKMRSGVPLTDRDRQPWLEAIRALIASIQARNGNAVIACSALKRAYRAYLRAESVQFVYLKADPALTRERLERREGHFFNPLLLESQFETLEEPRHAVVVSAEKPVSEIVAEIVHRVCPPRPADSPQ